MKKKMSETANPKSSEKDSSPSTSSSPLAYEIVIDSSTKVEECEKKNWINIYILKN